MEGRSMFCVRLNGYEDDVLNWPLPFPLARRIKAVAVLALPKFGVVVAVMSSLRCGSSCEDVCIVFPWRDGAEGIEGAEGLPRNKYRWG